MFCLYVSEALRAEEEEVEDRSDGEIINLLLYEINVYLNKCSLSLLYVVPVQAMWHKYYFVLLKAKYLLPSEDVNLVFEKPQGFI